MGIEIQHMSKVLKAIQFVCIQTAPGHQHIAYTAHKGVPKPLLCVQLVQFFQKAASLHRCQVSSIIVQIVIDHMLCDLHKETLEVIGIHYFTKAVTECFLHFFQIPILQLPEIDFPACSAVGIGQIEHIPKLIGNIPVDQKGNASCAFVDPSAKLVPCVDLCTGGCIRFLCVDQQLFLEIVLIVVCGGMQEDHIPFGIGGYAQRLLCRHFFYDLQFAGHFAPPNPV